MATSKKVNQLPTSSTISVSDLLPVADPVTGALKQVKVEDLTTGINAEWFGPITASTLSNAAMVISDAGGGTLNLPAGYFDLGLVPLKSNLSIKGQGANTIVTKPFPSDFSFGHGFDAVNDPTELNNIKGVRISDVTFKGTVETDGFSEFRHLLHINGCEDIIIERCRFIGFNGDAIYIGSGFGVEKHNRNITIRNCFFDGINKNNRNAISIIDCDGLKIHNCRFFNCSKPTMPGAIDLEPDASVFHVIKNIDIYDNYLKNIGGNVGAICAFLPLAQTVSTVAAAGTITAATNSAIINGVGVDFTLVPFGSTIKVGGVTLGTVKTKQSATQLTLNANSAIAASASAYTYTTGLLTPVKNIRIYNNILQDCAFGIGIFQRNTAGVSVPTQDVEVSRNKVYNTANYPFACYGLGGVTLFDNKFIGFNTNVKIGFKDVTVDYKCFNVYCGLNTLKDNNGDGQGISLSSVKLFISHRNTFNNIGLLAGTYGICIVAETNGVTDQLIFHDDIVLGALITSYTGLNPGHVTSSADNSFSKGYWDGVKGNAIPFTAATSTIGYYSTRLSAAFIAAGTRTTKHGSELLTIGAEGGAGMEVSQYTSGTYNGAVFEQVNRAGGGTLCDINFFTSNGIFKVFTAGINRLQVGNNGNIGVNQSSPAATAIVDIVHTSKGVLLPRMTTAQRDAIVSPANSLVIFNTDATATDGSTGVHQYYNINTLTWKNFN